MTHKNTLFSLISFFCACSFSFTLLGMQQDLDALNHKLYAAIKDYKENSIAEIQQLLQHGAKPDWIHPKCGDTALHNAVYLRSDVLKELLKYVQDCDVPASDGQTPLHRAMIQHMPPASQHSITDIQVQQNIFVKKNKEIVGLLLRYNADPLHKDLNGHTPITIADNHKNEEAKVLCLNSIVYIQNIHDAIATSNQKKFLEGISNPETPIHNVNKVTGNTFLHEAVLHEIIGFDQAGELYQHPSFIRTLIGKGLDINKRNALGQTAFFLACSQKKKLLVLYFLFCCPELEIFVTDKNGSTTFGFWITNAWHNMFGKLIAAAYQFKEEDTAKLLFTELPNFQE